MIGLHFCLLLSLGLLGGWLVQRLRLPGLLGMMAVGMLLGPSGFDLLSADFLAWSPLLRQLALLIILLRAGLGLDLEDLRRVGRPALLLCFVPALFEATASALYGPHFFGLDWVQAAVLGTVIAAVSPAVIVPKMLSLLRRGLGVRQGIPQMILAGASADDLFVLILFSFFSQLAQTGSGSWLTLLRLPTALLTGLAVGWLLGWLLAVLLRRFACPMAVTLALLLGLSYGLTQLEPLFTGFVGFSPLLAILFMGLILRQKAPEAARPLTKPLAELWVPAEVLLFGLVGAAVPWGHVKTSGGLVVLFLGLVLVHRLLGVYCCLIKTPFDWKERLFVLVSYLPKATVQAALGPVPLAMGLSGGSMILTVAGVSILLTAPLGALLIQMLAPRCLKPSAGEPH